MESFAGLEVPELCRAVGAAGQAAASVGGHRHGETNPAARLSLESLERFDFLQVPELCCVVMATDQAAASVGGHRHAIDMIGVSSKRVEYHALVQVPELCRPI